jgi:hypothetical protein
MTIHFPLPKADLQIFTSPYTYNVFVTGHGLIGIPWYFAR